MRKVKIIIQERGSHEDFEKKVQDYINNVVEKKYGIYDIKYSITYDPGYDDYVYSVLILQDG